MAIATIKNSGDNNSSAALDAMTSKSRLARGILNSSKTEICFRSADVPGYVRQKSRRAFSAWGLIGIGKTSIIPCARHSFTTAELVVDVTRKQGIPVNARLVDLRLSRMPCKPRSSDKLKIRG